jgi:hypothetical protein
MVANVSYVEGRQVFRELDKGFRDATKSRSFS